MKAPFSIVLADPPWTYDDKAAAGARGAEFKYPTMRLEDICALDVQSVTARDCALFLWATPPCLPEALDVLRAWDFDYSTVAFTWAKTRGTDSAIAEVRKILREMLPGMDGRAERILREVSGMLAPKWHIGMGKSTRANAEFCLLGRRGKLGVVDHGVRSLVISPVGRHSAKPPEVRDHIVRLLGDRPRLEMFARERADGWAAWGLDAPGGNDVEIGPRRPSDEARQLALSEVA